MTSPDAIAAAIKTTIASIPWVAANMTGVFANGDIGVSVHRDQPFNDQQRIAEHRTPIASVLIVQMAIGPGKINTAEMHSHTFSLVVRSPQGVNGFEAIKEIINGVPSFPSGNTVRLMNVNIHPNCELIDMPTAQRRTDGDELDFFELVLTLREIGENYT